MGYEVNESYKKKTKKIETIQNGEGHDEKKQSHGAISNFIH